jgi:hypothetical protein
MYVLSYRSNRPSTVVVDPLHDAEQLLRPPVLHRGAGERVAVRRGQPLDLPGALRLERLDGGRLVQHDALGLDPADVVPVVDDVLVAHDHVVRPVRLDLDVLTGPLLGVAVDEDAVVLRRHGDLLGLSVLAHLDDPGGHVGEFGDLLGPLVLQRGGDHDDGGLDLALGQQLLDGGQGDGCLAQAHLVGDEERPALDGAGHSVLLVGVQVDVQHCEYCRSNWPRVRGRRAKGTPGV